MGGVRIGVIGQAFPYTPIAHPRRFVPDLTFGIREDRIQALVDELRDGTGRSSCVVLLSHNGSRRRPQARRAGEAASTSFSAATRTTGCRSRSPVGRTLVVNSGSHGKFLSRLDLDVRGGRVAAHRYRLLPVLAEDRARTTRTWRG